MYESVEQLWKGVRWRRNASTSSALDAGVWLLAVALVGITGCRPDTEATDSNDSSGCPDGGNQICDADPSSSEDDVDNDQTDGDVAVDVAADSRNRTDPDTAAADADGGDGDDGGGYSGPTGGVGIPSRLDLSSFDQHYAAPDGGDDAAGTKDDPWSVDAAEANAGPGDVVHFLEGTYTTRLDPPSGEEGAPVVFRSHERHAARLERRGGNTVDISIDGKSHVVVQGFSVVPVEARWIHVKNSDHVTVRDNHMVRANMDGSGGPPFFVDRSQNIDIVNNLVHTTHNHDMMIVSDTDRVRLVGNAMAMSGHSVLAVKQVDDLVMRGNVLLNAVGRQAGIWKGDRALLEENLFTNAFSSPGSAAAASKWFRSKLIFRQNRLFRDWGAKIEMSMYDSSQRATDSRYYYNVFHDSTDHGYYSGEAHVIYGSGGGQIDDVEFTNNIYQDNGQNAARVQVTMRGLGDQALMFESNFFGFSSSSPRLRIDRTTLTVDEAQSQYPQYLANNRHGSTPGFVDRSAYDHRLSSQSELVDAGAHLAAAENSGPGKRLEVDDADYFFDGWGMPEESGDRIRVGDTLARIVDIQGTTLELAREVDWSSGDPVGLPWSGPAPDIGAFERGARRQVMVVSSEYVTPKGNSVTFRAETTGMGPPREICWQFGDGTGTCGAEVSHAFDNSGGFGIRVRVRDADGNYHWGTHHVLVEDADVDVTSFEYNKYLARKHLCNGESDPYTEPDETELYQEDDGDWDCR